MYKYLLDFIDTNNILFKYQFGFRKKSFYKSCKISSALDSRMSVVGCYIGLKKAFDTVDHNILLKNIDLCGIQGSILKWFKSYL